MADTAPVTINSQENSIQADPISSGPGDISPLVQNLPGTKPMNKAGEAKPTQDISKSVETFDVTIDGQKRSMTREQMIQHVQKSGASEKRFQEAAQARKAAEELTQKNQRLLQALSNPDTAEQVLEALKVDVTKLAERRLVKQYEDSILTPEQKQMRDMQAKLAQYEQRDMTEKQKFEAHQKQVSSQAAQKQVETIFNEVIGKHGLEPTSETFHQMASLAHQMVKNGLNLTPDSLALEVKEARERQMTKFVQRFADMPEDQLLNALPRELFEKFARASIKLLKISKTKPTQQSSSTSLSAPVDSLTPEEFKRRYKL